MKCSRLLYLTRNWYQEVRNFTLSPIKMMELTDRHIKQCPICQKDPDLPLILDQLRELLRVPYTITPKEEKNIEEPIYLYEEEIEDLEEEEI